MPAITSQRTEPHRFVPDALDATDAPAVVQLYDDLAARDLPTREALEGFILDWEELNAVVNERFTAAYVDMTSDTANPDYEAQYLRIVESVLPLTEQRNFELKRHLLASPAIGQLGDEYAEFLRNIRSEVEIFREENVPLLTEERRLDQEYEKISGGQTAEFQGKVYTLPQLLPFLEETDRKTREEAWRAREQAHLDNAAALDELYDRFYDVRVQIARNAGFDNFRDYQFKAMKRFDYTPEDCVEFQNAIEEYVVPFVNRDNERRRRLLGVDTLRPWDTRVDPEGNPPLRPFSTPDRLTQGCRTIFNKIDQELGSFFGKMMDERLLDLENRPGKSPGGYMVAFSDRRVPFIFMNAVGTKRDVETVLHEGGHAFHYFLARHIPLHSYHNTGLEFAEVASMSMEFFSRPYLGEFYTEEELRRLNDEQIRSTLGYMPFIAMIDAFQHWVYTAPDHGAEARYNKWAELEKRFRPSLDWSGLEQYRDIGWQYPHVFSVPFYYVEYGIAQLAAVRLWLNSLEDEKKALNSYKYALSLGGSRPLPELFSAAGAEFSLKGSTVRKIVEGATAQLSSRD